MKSEEYKKRQKLQLEHSPLCHEPSLYCLLMQGSNQPIKWCELNVFRNVDAVVWVAEVQSKHQNEEAKGIKVSLKWGVVVGVGQAALSSSQFAWLTRILTQKRLQGLEENGFRAWLTLWPC